MTRVADWSGPGHGHQVRRHDVDRHRLLPRHGSVPRRGEQARLPRGRRRPAIQRQPARTTRTTRSDTSTSRPRSSLDLRQLRGATGCPVAIVDGTSASASTPCRSRTRAGPTEALVIPVQLPDCRYIPQACLDLLPPAGDTRRKRRCRARAILIGLGVIKPLDPERAEPD